MKKVLLMLAMLVNAALLNAATIYVNVHNVNGNLISNAKVILYNSAWQKISTQYTDASGTATFALLDYGTYSYEVYYTGETEEYWGSDEGFSINSPTLTRDFTRYWPYKYSDNFPISNPSINQQVSLQFTIKNKLSFSRDVKVELWVDRDKSSTYDFHSVSSSQSISSNGTKTFTFNFTPTSSGNYYWKLRVLSYNDGASSFIATDSYFWTSAFTVIEPKGNLDLSVKNVNGNLIENAKVKLYLNGNLLSTKTTNSSGEVNFSNLDYDSYHYEVYYTGETEEFWGDNEIQINSSSVSETFSRNWPYKYSDNFPITNPPINQQISIQYTVKNKLSFSRDVKVELWVDRDKSSSYDYHSTSSSQSISSNGTKTFTFNFTPTSAGNYYWKLRVLSYNDGSGDYIVTDSYFWTLAFDVIEQKGNFELSVKNVNGNLIENAKVLLYYIGTKIDSQYTNSSGKVNFTNIDYNSYHYEVYYTGEIEEFWGDNEIQINSPSVSKTFTRNWPYKSEDNLPITSVSSNQQVQLSLTVKNPLSFSRNVKVELWIDKNKSDEGWSETSSEQTIANNSEQVFSFNYTPTLSGSYYYKYRILTYNDGANNYIPTDSYFWNDAFNINQTNLPQLNGIIVFHTYTSYFNFDGTLHILDLSKQTITDLNFNDWDGCANPSVSPDGNKLVFMAVPHSNHNYNNLELILYDISTGEIKRLTNNNVADEDPKFSPNGIDVVFKRNGDIYKINTNDNSVEQLTATPTVEEWAPFYSSDGSKIYYTSRTNNNDDIWQIDADGQNSQALIEGLNNEWYPQTVDSQHFLYTLTNNGDDIYEYTLSDGASEKLSTNSSSDDSDPFYIYDNYCGFSSSRDGNYDLYIGNMQTGEVWKIYDAPQTLSALGGSYPMPSKPTGIAETESDTRSFLLSQNYPNPFNPTTTIEYSLPSISIRGDSKVSLVIYDLLGRKIKTLVNKEQSSGIYKVTFDGSGLSSGIYFYRLNTGNRTEIKKFVLMK